MLHSFFSWKGHHQEKLCVWFCTILPGCARDEFLIFACLRCAMEPNPWSESIKSFVEDYVPSIKINSVFSFEITFTKSDVFRVFMSQRRSAVKNESHWKFVLPVSPIVGRSRRCASCYGGHRASVSTVTTRAHPRPCRGMKVDCRCGHDQGGTSEGRQSGCARAACASA